MVLTGADLTEITLNDLYLDPRFKVHHYATAIGYVSRKSDGYPVLYCGKFGCGIVWHLPSDISTRYHDVIYFICKE